MPFPFIHANGGICCSNPDFPCDNCKAKLAAEARARVTPKPRRAATRAASLRTAIPHDVAPPNGYRAAMDAGYQGEPSDDPDFNVSTGHPADPYKIALALRHLRAEDAAADRALAAATPDRELHYDANGVPDPYFAGIEQMRSANR